MPFNVLLGVLDRLRVVGSLKLYGTLNTAIAAKNERSVVKHAKFPGNGEALRSIRNQRKSTTEHSRKKLLRWL
jgi:hypothetical protein